ncbi:MAG: gliding motility-associated C-terminal domain-containing protein [Bacteroidales bacterium]|nr:gliding motility-associated C-terminal domain-containing protein [Bacteroidales bacterium]
MKTKVSPITIVSMLFALVSVSFADIANAQWSQQQACPGWNNPTSFNTGSSTCYYTGQSGQRVSATPNVHTQVTGASWNGDTYNTAVRLSNATGSSMYPYGNEGHKDPLKLFAIIDSSYTCTSAPSGVPIVPGYDFNTLNHLPFVPTQFNTTDLGVYNTKLIRSIRIGDCYAGSTTPPTSACALQYNMKVMPENAMLYIYYSIVVQNPSHGVSGNPEFVIRVMKANSTGTTWSQMSDTLAYYVSSTPSTAPGDGLVTFEPSFDSNGWHNVTVGGSAVTSSRAGSVNYKDWVKVGINLNNYLFENVRVEIIMMDCSAQYHFGYAYICGECRPMQIETSGCAAGQGTTVTRLSAPRGMLSYVWYASNWGVADPTNTVEPGGSNSHFTFRRLTPLDGREDPYSEYSVQANDFKVTRTRNVAGDSITIDSIGNLQTFRCDMTSAMNPALPFKSSLYVNVQNTKPTMLIDTIYTCDGKVKLANLSYVPGDETGLMVDSLTEWRFFGNTGGVGVPDSMLVGDSVVFNAPNSTARSVLVRSITTDQTCYAEGLYVLHPLENPRPRIAISNRVLCDADQTTLTDQSTDATYRVWRFLAGSTYDSTSGRYIHTDTLDGWYTNNRQVVRSFTHSIEPIELETRNGLYELHNNQQDTVWCSAIARDTVAVFVHPNLEVTGDTIVCRGTKTNAHVRAIGVDSCNFVWSTRLGVVTGGLPSGDSLAVEPYSDTSTYFVRVTSPQGCVAWDSIRAYLVRPALTINPGDGRICPGSVAVLKGLNASGYTWTSTPYDPSLVGQESQSEVRVSPSQNTTYYMVGHGSNGCEAAPLNTRVTIVPLPVPTVSLSPDFVDNDDPTVTLRDVSPYGVSSMWLFNNSEQVTGREVVHTFEESMGQDSVYVVLTSYNELNCPNDTTIAIPVKLFTTWFPNAFTPGSEDENAYFKLYSINQYENFHIYIYNRRGELMFESEDPGFKWDGTHNGEKCPQGSYAYVCSFRKPGTSNLRKMHGSITLIR